MLVFYRRVVCVRVLVSILVDSPTALSFLQSGMLLVIMLFIRLRWRPRFGTANGAGAVLRNWSYVLSKGVLDCSECGLAGTVYFYRWVTVPWAHLISSNCVRCSDSYFRTAHCGLSVLGCCILAVMALLLAGWLGLFGV